jgi:hypothetical protein
MEGSGGAEERRPKQTKVARKLQYNRGPDEGPAPDAGVREPRRPLPRSDRGAATPPVVPDVPASR